MTTDLAIVIPAYKPRHLQPALASIAAQTDQRFRIYIGDDASPHALESIVRASGIDPARLYYRRFETNLGGQSLVKHWHRCIELSSEPWVWLFSDDDVMDPDCVAAFHRHLASTDSVHDLYRFNTAVIDANGTCTSLNPTHPTWESARDLAYFLLRGHRQSTQQELIFRREAYHQTGGFIDLPLAWYADSVFALSIGRKLGVYTLTGPKVRFRVSGDNISSRSSPQLIQQKWDALMQFAAWIDGFIMDSADGGDLTNAMMKDALHQRFLLGLRTPKAWINGTQRRRFRTFLEEHFPDHCAADGLRILKCNVSAGLRHALALVPRR